MYTDSHLLLKLQLSLRAFRSRQTDVCPSTAEAPSSPDHHPSPIHLRRLLTTTFQENHYFTPAYHHLSRLSNSPHHLSSLRQTSRRPTHASKASAHPSPLPPSHRLHSPSALIITSTPFSLPPPSLPSPHPLQPNPRHRSQSITTSQPPSTSYSRCLSLQH